MNNLEFINFTIENWPTLICWAVFIMVLLFIFFKNVTPTGLYDPFHFYVTFNLGTGYAVLISLYQYGHISNFLFVTMLFFAVVLLGSLHYFLKSKTRFSFKYYKFFFSPVRNGSLEFSILLAIYVCFSVIILATAGMGALSSAERFENARGGGMFIRVADFFRLVILAYIALKIIQIKKINYKKVSLIFSLVLFLLFSSLLGGAKYAFLEGLFVIFVAIGKFAGRIRMGALRASMLVFFSTIFAVMLIYLGDKSKGSGDGIYNDSTNIFIQKFANRILANGDSYYGSLPNNVIDEIQVDAVWVRFLSPIIGVSQTTKLVGYPVENFSVGRAILLYFDPGNEISGGPVSHYDIFSYVYFGLFGFIFIFFIAYIIANIGASMNASKNIFYIAVTAALWNRCLAIMLEPTVGLAYVLDAVILIGLIKAFSFGIYAIPIRRKILRH